MQAKPAHGATPQANLARLSMALAAQGHVLLEPHWLGWRVPYRFRCAQGHELARAPEHILRTLINCPACRKAKALARLKDLARQAGGECLSEHYVGHDKQHAFRCAQGHMFNMKTVVVVSGSWCGRCATARNADKSRDPQGLARLNAIARQHGGECLSTHYTRQKDRYTFRCARGHTWAASGSDVTAGSWCRLCVDMVTGKVRLRQDGLAELQRIALSRNGLCLARSYAGVAAYYDFRCEKGHEWQTTGATIFRGRWCTTCSHEKLRLGIEMMQSMAAERGGRCLSTTYVKSNVNLEWECARGHRWQAPPSTIRAGHWCAQCHHLSRITVEKTRRLRRYESA